MHTATILAYAVGLASSHVIQVHPPTYVFAADGHYNPLQPDGSDFPCKMPPGVNKLKINGSPTPMVIGETQTLELEAFDGAVHGGGSCQIALTEGFEPNKHSKWSVIHSIEGGCPKANIRGNIQDGSGPDKFPYTIPDGIAPGDYTQAWVWVNRIGQAVEGGGEIYMNCAPIRVSSGQDSTARIRNRREKFSKRADFPGLFLANLGPVSNGCLTHEANVDQMAIAYPNPGDSVAHPEGTKSLLQQPCDGNVRNAGFHGGAETSAPAPAPAAEEPPVTPKPKPAQPNPENEPEASQPSAENPPVIVPAPAPAVNPPNNDPATSTTCTEGHLRCNEGKTSFSTCTGGKWTNPQSLAQDTTCRLGEGEGLVVITPFDDPQIPEGLV